MSRNKPVVCLPLAERTLGLITNKQQLANSWECFHTLGSDNLNRATLYLMRKVRSGRTTSFGIRGPILPPMEATIWQCTCMMNEVLQAKHRHKRHLVLVLRSTLGNAEQAPWDDH